MLAKCERYLSQGVPRNLTGQGDHATGAVDCWPEPVVHLLLPLCVIAGLSISTGVASAQQEPEHAAVRASQAVYVTEETPYKEPAGTQSVSRFHLGPEITFAPLGPVNATVVLPAPCCLPTGTCEAAVFEDDCKAAGGTVVAACVGDSDDSGRDDACEMGGCCNAGACAGATVVECVATGGVYVPECFGDTNSNGSDDACECVVASVPEPETLERGAGHGALLIKNRFLSVRVGDPGRSQAIQVTYRQLPPPYDIWNDTAFFAGRPQQICENPGQGPSVPVEECGVAPGSAQKWFWAAPLVCDVELAVFRDWTELSARCVDGDSDGRPCTGDGDCSGGRCGSDGLIHLYHAGVVPSKLETPNGPIGVAATYEVQLIDKMCGSSVECSYSSALTLSQAGWGDVISDISQCPNGPPDERIDVTDVLAVLNKFSNSFCAPIKTRADLVPANVDFKINITDAVFCLDTFTGADYPLSAQCNTDADCCGGLSCVDAVCVTEAECATEGVACTVSDDCCQGLICSAGLCDAAAPLPGKGIAFDLIGIHDADSDSFDANCTDAACHGDRHTELALDGATPAAHGTMLTLFPEGNDRCFACHTSGPDFLTYSAGALRQQIDMEATGCALRSCHGPNSPHPLYVRE